MSIGSNATSSFINEGTYEAGRCASTFDDLKSCDGGFPVAELADPKNAHSALPFLSAALPKFLDLSGYCSSLALAQELAR